MTNETDADGQLHASAAQAEGSIRQQNMMRETSRTGSESENDVLMMDDVQFTASLDRLLDSELVHSAYNTVGGPRIVSTDPSVASSASSRAVARASQKQTGMAAPAPLPVSGGSGSLGPPTQRPLNHPAVSNSLLPPPPNKPATAMGPSPLTQRLAFAMPVSTAPATVRSSLPETACRKQAPTPLAGTKRRRDPSLPVSEDETERERRRQDRNMREQQRSRRITEQIMLLRDVLLESDVPCKPDKNSILIRVYEYISQLQSRSDMLDAEHKKLLDTIARTNEMVNNQYFQASTDGTSSVATPAPVSNDLLSDANEINGPLEDENVVFVQGLDYKSVFKRCGIALAVASIDGRFIDCNSEFVTLSGYSRKELLPGEELSKTELNPDAAPSATMQANSTDPPPRNLSLFNLLSREDMERVFTAMSVMLRRQVLRNQDSAEEGTSIQQDHWSGFVRQNQVENATVGLCAVVSRSLTFSNLMLRFPSFQTATSHKHNACSNSQWTPQVLQLLLDGRLIRVPRGRGFHVVNAIDHHFCSTPSRPPIYRATTHNQDYSQVVSA